MTSTGDLVALSTSLWPKATRCKHAGPPDTLVLVDLDGGGGRDETGQRLW
jgi:hypothetical protein